MWESGYKKTNLNLHHLKKKTQLSYANKQGSCVLISYINSKKFLTDNSALIFNCAFHIMVAFIGCFLKAYFSTLVIRHWKINLIGFSLPQHHDYLLPIIYYHILQIY